MNRSGSAIPLRSAGAHAEPSIPTVTVADCAQGRSGLVVPSLSGSFFADQPTRTKRPASRSLRTAPAGNTSPFMTM